jgi:glutamate dehydrogenase (NAD(P)+)
MTPDVGPAELARLSRQMTLKLALAELPIGGAKGGIVCALPHGTERDRQLRAFGELAAPLLRGGIYLGSDQGITYRDRAVIFEAAGYEVADHGGHPPLPCSWAELWDRCYGITGFGLAEAICAVLHDDRQRGRLGPRSPAPTVVVQGFGTVGRGAASHLTGRGFRIVAVADRQCTVARPEGLTLDPLLAATDPAGLIDRAALPPEITVRDGPEAWLDVPADVLLLAAGSGALRADNVHRVNAGLVVEGANQPCTDAALAVLDERAIPVVPGLVANAGGAIATGVVLTGQAPPAPNADSLAAGLHEEVRRRIIAAFAVVGKRATAEGISLVHAAERVAAERVEFRPEEHGKEPQKVG